MNSKVATINSGGVKRTIRHIFDIVNQKTPLNSYGEMTMDDFSDVMTSLGTPLKHFVYTTTTYSQEPIVILTGLKTSAPEDIVIPATYSIDGQEYKTNLGISIPNFTSTPPKADEYKFSITELHNPDGSTERNNVTKSVNILDGVGIYTLESMFRDVQSLTSVTFQPRKGYVSNWPKIWDYAFAGCTSLTDVIGLGECSHNFQFNKGANREEILYSLSSSISTFEGCSSLKEIDLTTVTASPNGVNAEHMFTLCTSMQSYRGIKVNHEVDVYSPQGKLYKMSGWDAMIDDTAYTTSPAGSAVYQDLDVTFPTTLLRFRYSINESANEIILHEAIHNVNDIYIYGHTRVNGHMYKTVLQSDTSITDEFSNDYNGCIIPRSCWTDGYVSITGPVIIRPDVSGCNWITDASKGGNGVLRLIFADGVILEGPTTKRLVSNYAGCVNFTIGPNGVGLDTSRITDMSYMFYLYAGMYGESTTTGYNLAIRNLHMLDVSNVTTMRSMFEMSGAKFIFLPKTGSNVKDISYMFMGMHTGPSTVDLRGIDFSSVENLSLFKQYTNDISTRWYVSSEEAKQMLRSVCYCNGDIQVVAIDDRVPGLDP